MRKLFFIGLLAIGTVVYWSSCDLQPKSLCDGVKCYNKGICIDGTCDCKYGWGGAHCDSLVNNCGLLDCGPNSIDCYEGVCNCKDGYEGDTCSIASRTKFLGDFIATEICDGNNINYNCSLDTVFSSDVTLQWKNFHNLPLGDKIVAKAIKSNLTIASQLTTSYFRVKDATGSINTTLDTVTFDYKLTNVLQNTTTTCHTILVRQ